MLTTIVHVHLIILVLRNLQMLFDSGFFQYNFGSFYALLVLFIQYVKVSMLVE